MTKTSMMWLPHFWGAFKTNIRHSGDAEYLLSEENQAHLKVPDNQPVLEFHFYSARRHSASPQQVSKNPVNTMMEGALLQDTWMSQHWESNKYLEKSSTTMETLISFMVFLWLVFNSVLP